MSGRWIRFNWPWRSKREIQASIDEELEFHLAARADELGRAGHTPAEARRLAIAEFGDVAGTRTYCESEGMSMERAARRREHAAEALQDLRYGIRSLLHQPGFAFAAIATLALGVGANTAVFGIIHGVLLSPLPYRAPDELVAIAQGMRKQAQGSAVSPPNYLDMRSETRALADAGAYYPNSATLTGRGEPIRVNAPVMTPSLFSTLGVPPKLGRAFAADEGSPGRDRVAMLSHGFWLRHFGGDRSAIGAAVRLDGEPYIIIGVMPAEFSFPVGEADLWLPLGWDAGVATQRGAQYIRVVGRLRAGTPAGALGAELETLARRLEAGYPKQNLDLLLVPRPLAEQVVGDSRPVLLLLAGAVSLVILIASSNVANLLLARVTRRAGEFAVRAALGAGRGRLMRQLAAEGLLLGGCGGLGGLLIGWGGVAALKRWWPDVVPRHQEIGIDLTVAAFAIGVALAASLAAALVPSWRMSGERSAGRSSEPRAATRRAAIASATRWSRPNLHSR